MQYNALMRSLSLEKLVQKCIRRDNKAWAEFVRRFEGLLLRAVKYKMRRLKAGLPKEECRDIVQEVFLSIWNNDRLSGIRNLSSIRSWLVLVAINATSNYCARRSNKHARLTRSLQEKASPDVGVTLEEVIPSPTLKTGDMVKRSEARRTLDAELGKLKPKQQLALKLNLFEGKTHKDIAGIMKIPEKTVTTLIRRGKENMRPGLREIYNNF